MGLMFGTFRRFLRPRGSLRKRLIDVPRTSRSRSGPNLPRRSAAITTKEPVVGPNSLKRPSENPEHPPCKAPYQNFQFLTGHLARRGLLCQEWTSALDSATQWATSQSWSCGNGSIYIYYAYAQTGSEALPTIGNRWAATAAQLDMLRDRAKQRV